MFFRRVNVLIIIVSAAILATGAWLFSGLRALPQTPMAPPTRVTVAFTGDVLMHSSLNKAAHTAKGTYDYHPMFAPIAPYLQQADYVVANLETRLAGEDKGYSGYPRFNTPASLTDALKSAGISLLGLANNHCMDMGAGGLLATIDTLDAAGIPHVGNYRSAAEQSTPLIADIKGIKVAFLNYTAMTNGIPVPASMPYAVNLIGDGSRLILEAATARAQGADLVIAFLHFGTEYQRKPSADQQVLVKKLLASGVDAVVGAHPHMVQPISRVTVWRGKTPYTGVVAYSLGNFVSAQRDRYKDDGIVLYLTIEKDAAGARIRGVCYLPVWVQRGVLRGRIQYRLTPVLPGVDAGSDVPLTPVDQQRRRAVWTELNTMLNQPAKGIVPCPAKAAGKS